MALLNHREQLMRWLRSSATTHNLSSTSLSHSQPHHAARGLPNTSPRLSVRTLRGRTRTKIRENIDAEVTAEEREDEGEWTGVVGSGGEQENVKEKGRTISPLYTCCVIRVHISWKVIWERVPINNRCIMEDNIKLNLTEYGISVSTTFVWLRIKASGGHFAKGNEPKNS
jgi:hypothetical protein